MSEFIVSIYTDLPDFRIDNAALDGIALSMVLRFVAHKVLTGEVSGSIKDKNGNEVGTFKYVAD